MRYYIIFGITIILVLIILFYNPYLAIYKDTMTIEYSFEEEDYSWNYYLNNNNLVLSSSDDNKWVFKTNSNGITELNYKYCKNDSKDDCKYLIYYKFKIRGKKIYWLEGSGKGLLDYPNPY